MLQRLDAVLGQRLGDLDARIAELCTLRDEIARYQTSVRQRVRGGGRSAA
jgi:uncharacterized small protein (DUF1192 family)